MSEENPPNETFARLVVPRMNFGQTLMHLRLDQELTIAQVSENTHISIDTIQNIESGDLEQIGLHPYYCRSLIERLCMAYDSPTDEVMNAYELDRADYFAKFGKYPEIGNTADDLDEASRAPRRISALLIALLMVLLLLLIVGGWGYKRYQQHQQSTVVKDYELPSLIEMTRPPLETLPIPES